MAFSIKATFRFGFYQGHNGGEKTRQLESYPNLLRLQQAFMAAGYSLYENQKRENSNEQELDERLELPEDIAEAICWFEDNPPDAIDLPEVKRNEHAEECKAFREKGNWQKKQGEKPSIRKPKTEAVSRVQLSGPIIWFWESEPNKKNFDILKQLACEVPYLGETLSSVALQISKVAKVPECAYVLYAVNKNGHKCISKKFRYPRKDNATELQEFYNKLEKQSKNAFNEERKARKGEKEEKKFEKFKEFSSCMQHKYKIASYYKDEVSEEELVFTSQCAPWQQGLLLEVENTNTNKGWKPYAYNYVKWANCIHGALVNIITDGKKDREEKLRLSFMTKENNEFANGLSIQIIPQAYKDKLAFELPNENDAVLLMFPYGASKKDISYLQTKLSVGEIEIKAGRLGKINMRLDEERLIDLSLFWKKPQNGIKRLWKAAPCYIADNKKPTKRCLENSYLKEKKWTIEDSIRVSAGYVFKDVMDNFLDDREIKNIKEKKGDEKRIAISNAMKSANIKADWIELPDFSSYKKRYIHKANETAQFLAADALIDLGKFSKACNTAAIAIGQSRHFSGGFLVPVDIMQTNEN